MMPPITSNVMRAADGNGIAARPRNRIPTQMTNGQLTPRSPRPLRRGGRVPVASSGPVSSDRLWAVKQRGRLPLTILGLAAAPFLLSSCEGLGGISPIFPTPVSPNGQDIYNTYIGISIPAIIIFIGVEAALLWVVIKYRRSAQPVGYVPPQVHGNTRLEIAWTIAPLIVVLAIALYSFDELQKDFQPVS